MFSFFEETNWETLIKMLDGCSHNGYIWVSGTATTDLGYSIVVTDTMTAQAREYRNEPGLPAPAITDVTAFRCGSRGRRAAIGEKPRPTGDPF